MKELGSALKSVWMRIKWVFDTWYFVPPWTKFLVRYALKRHQHFGDRDIRANIAWNLAKRLTWDKISMQRYAANCLVYGLGGK